MGRVIKMNVLLTIVPFSPEGSVAFIFVLLLVRIVVVRDGGKITGWLLMPLYA